jgi:hypothetical protein
MVHNSFETNFVGVTKRTATVSFETKSRLLLACYGA